MRELILPTTRLHGAFLQCLDDWGPGRHEYGFGLGDEEDVRSADGFAAWVRARTRLTHPAGTPCPAAPHGSPRWIVEDGEVVGGIALRHHLDDDLGHLGYGIRPSARRRGLATWALDEMLEEARVVLETTRVLIVCLADNIGSIRTIERNGGVLEGVRDSVRGPARRYWVPLDRGQA